MRLPLRSVTRLWFQRDTILLPALVAGVLALLPFLWLGSDASLGGDDTRLYFVYPRQWLTELALPAFGTLSGFGNFSPQQYFIPITALLAAFQIVVPWLNLQALVFSLALMSGFVGTYATVLLLLPGRVTRMRCFVATLAGTLYVSAPLVATMYWSSLLTWNVGVGGAPVLIALATAYIKSGHLKWMLAFAVLDLFYSVGLQSLPVSLPFVIGTAIVAGTIVLVGPVTRIPSVRRGGILIAVSLGTNAFWMLPLLASIGIGGSVGSEALATGADAAGTARAVTHGESILYTLVLLPSPHFLEFWNWPSVELADWAHTFIIPSLLLPAVLAASLLGVPRRRKRIAGTILAIVAAMLVLAYLETVKITQLGVDAFAALSTNVPGFGMFRNFYNKFAGAYTFFFCLAFALALNEVLARLRSGYRPLLMAPLAATIVLQGAPMLLGMPLFLPLELPRDQMPAYGQVGHLAPAVLQAMNYLAGTDNTGRVLELPLSNNYWSVFPLSSPNTVYVGSSPTAILSGHGPFNSSDSFAVDGMPQLQYRFDLAVTHHDFVTLGAILRISGIRYILYVDGLPSSAQITWLHQPLFPRSDGEMAALARALGARNIASFSGAGSAKTQLYALPKESVLPEVFVATQAQLVRSGDDIIDKAAYGTSSYSAAQVESAGQSTPVSALPALAANDPQVLVDTVDAAAITRVVHTLSWRYALDVDTNHPSVIVLLDPYAADWRAKITYPRSNAAPADLPKLRVNGYASAWLLRQAGRFSIDISYVPQRLTWIAGSISLLTILALLGASIIQRRSPKGAEGVCHPQTQPDNVELGRTANELSNVQT